MASNETGAIGALVFAENVPTPDNEDFLDFALIRLWLEGPHNGGRADGRDPDQNQQCRGKGPARLRVYGQATGVSQVAPPRRLLTTSLERPDHVYAHRISVVR